jgi:hypothetical protein
MGTGLGLALAACQGSPAVTPTPTASATSAAASACHQTTAPQLVGPDGQQIVLSPAEATSAWTSETGETYYLRQVGECVWMATYVPVEETGGPDPFLSVFLGRLTTDLLIVGEFADLTGVLVPGWDVGSLTYRISPEGDAIVLVEDRSDGSGPPGCISGDGLCPPPRRLERVVR